MTSSEFIRQLEQVLRPYGQSGAKFGYHKYTKDERIVIEESANKDKSNTTKEIILINDHHPVIHLCLGKVGQNFPQFLHEETKIVKRHPDALLFIADSETSVTVLIVEMKSTNSKREAVLQQIRGGYAMVEYVKLLTANLVRNSNWYSLNFRFIGVEFKRPKPEPPTTELVVDPLSESKHTDFVENAENNLVKDEVHPALHTYANPFPSVEPQTHTVKEYPLTQLLAGVVKQ